jgi:hypothetical protein
MSLSEHATAANKSAATSFIPASARDSILHNGTTTPAAGKWLNCFGTRLAKLIPASMAQRTYPVNEFSPPGGSNLRRQIVDIGAEAGAEAIAVAFYDYLHRTGWSYHSERWFHAASTVKVPVLLGVFAAIDQGLLQPYSRVHVRNRFLSAADGSPYRVDPVRDSNSEVHAALGKTMQIRELARHMIVTSSNRLRTSSSKLLGSLRFNKHSIDSMCMASSSPRR